MSIDGGLRSVFRDKLRAGFDWTSVETGITGRGVPDSNYCMATQPVSPQVPSGAGVEGWIEFKQTRGWACTLRPEQVGWILRRMMYGGRVFIATRRQHDGHSRSDAVDELWLHDGRHAEILRDNGLRGSEPLYWGQGGPSNWDWDRVRAALAR